MANLTIGTGESESIRLGPYDFDGHVEITATDDYTLYVSSVKVGNTDRIIGAETPVAALDQEVTAFLPGDVITICLLNKGALDQQVQIGVRQDLSAI